MNQEQPPSIADLHKVFLNDGVDLAIKAAQKALDEAKIDPSQITHIVATTCTDSANPGFDHFLAKGLEIRHPVEKVLLHGVGCSGGLAALRTGANLALAYTARERPARVLCVALELCTTLARSELESINELQETRIGACLFSDCASAVVLSNGLGETIDPIYRLLGWSSETIPETEDDLGFDVDPSGKLLSPIKKSEINRGTNVLKAGRWCSHLGSPRSRARRYLLHLRSSWPPCRNYLPITKKLSILTGLCTQAVRPFSLVPRR